MDIDTFLDSETFLWLLAIGVILLMGIFIWKNRRIL
jgi:sensor domain CHASE-containing protein